MPTFLASQKPLMVSLARWSAPADPAAFEAECAKLQDKKDFAALATKLRTAMLAKLASANEADGRNAFAILLQLLVQWKVLAAQAEPLADEPSAASLRPLPMLGRPRQSAAAASHPVRNRQEGVCDDMFKCC